MGEMWADRHKASRLVMGAGLNGQKEPDVSTPNSYRSRKE